MNRRIQISPCGAGWLYVVYVGQFVYIIGLATTRERALREAKTA